MYSHWLLDAVMHADAEPLRPFSGTNPFLTWSSVDQLNAACLVSIAAGCLMLIARRMTEARRAAPAPHAPNVASGHRHRSMIRAGLR